MPDGESGGTTPRGRSASSGRWLESRFLPMAAAALSVLLALPAVGNEPFTPPAVGQEVEIRLDWKALLSPARQAERPVGDVHDRH